MNKRTIINILLAFLVLGFATVVIQAAPSPRTSSNSPLPTLSSPLPTPPAPTPTPPPASSAEAQAALAYLAQREGIPASSLVVVTDHRTEYPNLGRQFQVVTLLDTRPQGRFYNLLVDRSTGAVIEDVASLWRAEERARTEKYGKLQPALYERLQTMQDTDVVTVTIWAAAGPGQSLPEREVAAIAALAAKYPEARAAVERGSKPMDVDDPVLAERIYKEYVELVEGGAAQRVQPLVEALEAQGITIQTSAGLPAVTASLAKRDILLLAQRGDVGTIYLADGGHLQLLLDSAVSSNRAPAVWTRGYDGTGVKVAIVETDNVDFTSPDGSQCPASSNNCFQHPGITRWGLLGEQNHATLVASTAASNHSIYKGMAPGATIMSAGIQSDSRQGAIDALVWAFDQGADVVNASFGICTGSTVDVIDKAFDHYARNRNKMISVAAGNTTSCNGDDHVMSPAKGWNLLSVGAYSDGNDANWSNDVIASFSGWRNPDSPNLDHEKPEVVAPGVEIVGIGLDGNPVTDPQLNSGTSFAAPQVAGLAALLIDRRSSLSTWPEAMRAIIMASAVHNVQGPSDIPTGQDLQDGAGAIDAALADTIARTRWTSATFPCTVPCWWGDSIDNTNFPVGTWRYRYFTASRGERIRVAIAWWSNADCASESSCNYDRLDTNLNLTLFYPNGQFVSSGSYDNNYELVDFIAPQTGQYQIGVYKYSANETSNFLGIAWVKDSIYLPDLRNQDGWVSEFYVRNGGTQVRGTPTNPKGTCLASRCIQQGRG